MSRENGLIAQALAEHLSGASEHEVAAELEDEARRRGPVRPSSKASQRASGGRARTAAPNYRRQATRNAATRNAPTGDWRARGYDDSAVGPPVAWRSRRAPEAPPYWLRALLRLIPPPVSTAIAPVAIEPADAAAAPAPEPPPVDAATPEPAAPAAPPDATPAGELQPWQRGALRGELEARSGGSAELAAGLARWNLATGLSAPPTLAGLIERWRPVHAPEIPATLLVAFSSFEARDWQDATHGSAGSGFTSPAFYELGVFQVPAGLHGPCTEKGCGLQPPGSEKPGAPSAWSRICQRLQLDPKKWTDPVTQVRVGLCNLEDDARVIRKRYPELFPQPGSDWDLRAAVLLPFVGIGFANSLLKKHRQQLAQLPEGSRWKFLREQAIAANPNRAARMRELLANVEKKMARHAVLKAHFAGVSPSSAASAAPATPPVPGGDLPLPTAGTSVEEFCTRLGALWSRQRRGNPTPASMRVWLLKEHQKTLTGAAARFKGRYPEAALTRAWMTSVEQQMKFQKAAGSLKSLATLRPPPDSAARVSSPLVGGSTKEQVAPVVVRFVQELRRRYASFSADTYRGHGLGSFAGKGYSIDLYLSAGQDARGFFKPDAAVKFLRALGQAAQAVNLEWRVLYNDFSVAELINRESGMQRVVFVGSASKGGLNWHGPHPLILHFHLDLGAPG